MGLHIKNILSDKELDNRTVKDFFTVQEEGGRNVVRRIKTFNLDMIISVGVRVKSQRGIVFRQW
ncbi:MAG: virulence RhuM family protein, partial [Spirochaetales bacterium]|nr:virulence RhuM family protein [Spirochaetales bacterium]